MTIKYLLPLVTLVSGQLANAQQEKAAEPRASFANLSIVGPLSTSGPSYAETSVHFCAGFIGCSSRSLEGVGISYLYNSTYQDMSGIAVAGIGNISLGAGTGIHFGYITNVSLGSFHGLQVSTLNVTGGDLKGAQVGYVNYVQASGTGLQAGFLNVIANDQPDSNFAVQAGFLNVSNQSKVIPIGILSIVKGGRFSVGLDRDALGYYKVPILIGSRYFYTIINRRSAQLNSNGSENNPKNFVRGAGLGGALPVTAEFLGKFEYVYYTPTGWRSDLANVIRAVGEYELSPYFSMHAGVERLGFISDRANRSSATYARKRQTTSLTAGFSLNLLGWWR